MSILERIRRITRANVNEVLDKAESPEKMLKQRIRDLEETMTEAKKALADFSVAYKKVEKEQEQAKRLAGEWELKAEQAIRAGDDSMAKRALGEKLKAQDRDQVLEPSVDQSRRRHAELRDNLTQLQDQLTETKLKLTEFQTRKQAAAAQKSFTQTMDKTGSSSPDGDLAKLEEEVLRAESEAEIEADIRGGGRSHAEVERKSKNLLLESELDAMKKRLGKT